MSTISDNGSIERFCARIVTIISPERISYPVETANLRDNGISSAPNLSADFMSNLSGKLPPGAMIGRSTELGSEYHPCGTGGDSLIAGIAIGPSLINLTSKTPVSPPAGHLVSTPSQKCLKKNF